MRGSATAVRITAILTAVGCCLAAAAYATVRYTPASPPPGGEGSRPLRPRIVVHPKPATAETVAEFDISQPGRPTPRAHRGFPLGYECRLDDGDWEPCSLPLTLTSIGRGTHRFYVRAVNRAGRTSPIAWFLWRRVRGGSAAPPATGPVAESPSSPAGSASTGRPPAAVPSVEPPPVIRPPSEEPSTPPAGLPFKIEQVGSLEDLLPGAPAQTIEVQVENPNLATIAVTSLTATVANEPPGCPPAENFILTPAAVSPAAPLVVPAETVVSLAEAEIAGPTIAMVNLPVSQDACEAAELEISLSGVGSG